MPASNEHALKSVLVTGASTGIGLAAVQHLSARGWRVFASVRRQEDAERLGELANVQPLLFDVSDADAVRAAGAQVEAECGESGLDGVVNNAGIAVAGPLEFLPPAELRRQLEVNVIGQVAVTQSVFGALRRARGRIVFVGSIAGRSAMPFMGAYSASKHALEAIADSWRVELAPWGMHVSIVEPGVIATPIWQTSVRAADTWLGKLPAAAEAYYGRIIAGLKRRVENNDIGGLDPLAVARVIEHALTADRPQPRYLVGRDAKRRVWFNRLPTRLRDRLILEGLKRL